jgi:hypothetical protein
MIMGMVIHIIPAASTWACIPACAAASSGAPVFAALTFFGAVVFDTAFLFFTGMALPPVLKSYIYILTHKF